MAYDQQYFDWQKKIGIFGGTVNLNKFLPFISTNDAVLEFGCGGGYLLKNIQSKQTIGIEINPVARENAKGLGLIVFEKIEEVPDDYANIAISNHVLEHVDNPIETLRALNSKIKKNGKLVFVVPHEKACHNWDPTDINQHLYTWNQMTLGNLFQRAGYKIVSVDKIWHTWPPKFALLYKIFGDTFFHWLCFIEAVRTNTVQIRVVAEKI